MPFREPGYDDLLCSGKLKILGNIADATDVDYFVITVGTPLMQHIETDLSAVTKVILSLCPRLSPGQTIICAARPGHGQPSMSPTSSKPTPT